MYSRQAMSEYYQKTQERDFYDQNMKKYANEHTMAKATNEKIDRFQYKLEQVKPQFTTDEQRVIEQYETDIKKRTELEALNRQQQEQVRRQQEEIDERVRYESKKQRVLEGNEDLKNLRRAINTATVSKHNHEQIFQKIEYTKEVRDAERNETIQHLEQAEAIARAKAEADFLEQEKIRKETYQFMLQAAEEKARRRTVEGNEELQLERKLVQEAVKLALAEREKQIQTYKNKVQTAIKERDQCVADIQVAKEEQLRFEREQEDRIKKYNAEQEQRVKERLEMNKFRASQFDALLNKMAEINRNVAQKKQRMEDLRIKIAQFYEDEKQKQRELAEKQAIEKSKQMYLVEMQETRQQRAVVEAKLREEEEYHKKQIMDAYAQSQAVEAANRVKKQQMMVDYRDQIEGQINETRQRREQEEVARISEEQHQIRTAGYDEEALQMITEERMRLVRECAAQVFDYMNQGDFKEEDLQVLPEELQQKIKQMREERAYKKCGVVGEDRQVIQKIPDRAKIEKAQEALEIKKRNYKCALPW